MKDTLHLRDQRGRSASREALAQPIDFVHDRCCSVLNRGRLRLLHLDSVALRDEVDACELTASIGDLVTVLEDDEHWIVRETPL